MSDLEHQQALADLACPDGGWPYAPGEPAHLEPTCLALLALADAPAHDARRQAALAWLETCAVGDGTYRLERGRREAAWPTALVLFTRSALGDDDAKLAPLAGALLALKGRTVDLKSDNDVSDIDGELIGWPWAEGNFSWVEPTSWAMLALRRLGQGRHERVAQGRQLLLDRTLGPGGLNYGNRSIFGISLEPIPTPTALALLALQGDDDGRVRKSAEYLKKAAQETQDVDHLGWAILALDATGADEQAQGALRQRLRDAVEARKQVPYVRPSSVRAALTCLALATPGRNPFRLPKRPDAAPLQPGALSSPPWSIGGWAKSVLDGLAVFAAGHLRPLPPASDVHIAPAEDYNGPIADVLSRQYEHFREKVPLKGRRVVLKPNLVEYHREKVINTDPRFVAGVIELCKREGAAEVIVAEGPGHWRNVEYLVGASGLGDVLRHYSVPFVDLNHDEPVRRANLGRLTGLEHLYLTRTVDTSQVLISLPRLKTHHWAVATLSLKNLFGTLPGICYGWPKNELHWRGIHNSIVDIALTRPPDLAIVDAIIGMEGDGPLNGTARPLGALIMGSDCMAVDATCCRLMQLDPAQVGYLQLGQLKKLGRLAEGEIPQLGEPIAGLAQPFETLPEFRKLYLGRSA